MIAVGVPACTYPGTTIGGNISLVKFLYAIGETVNFTCADAYQLMGEQTLRCLDSAKWSHPVPSCVPKSRDEGMSRYMGIIYPDGMKGNGMGMINNDVV